jgi:hypothetical protein
MQLMMFDMGSKAIPKHGCPISAAMANREPEDEYERREWDAWIARRVEEVKAAMLSTGLRGMPLTRYLRTQHEGNRNVRPGKDTRTTNGNARLAIRTAGVEASHSHSV